MNRSAARLLKRNPSVGEPPGGGAEPSSQFAALLQTPSFVAVQISSADVFARVEPRNKLQIHEGKERMDLCSVGFGFNAPRRRGMDRKNAVTQLGTGNVNASRE